MYESDHNKMVRDHVHNGPIWVDENNDANGLNCTVRRVTSKQYKEMERLSNAEPCFNNPFYSQLADALTYQKIHTLDGLTAYHDIKGDIQY